MDWKDVVYQRLNEVEQKNILLEKQNEALKECLLRHVELLQLILYQGKENERMEKN